MKLYDTYTTGSRRGYIHVADRGVKSELRAIPESLKGLRGNRRWALERLKAAGCTHYHVALWRGVPGKGYNNQYCHAEYYGYKAEPED